MLSTREITKKILTNKPNKTQIRSIATTLEIAGLEKINFQVLIKPQDYHQSPIIIKGESCDEETLLKLITENLSDVIDPTQCNRLTIHYDFICKNSSMSGLHMLDASKALVSTTALICDWVKPALVIFKKNLITNSIDAFFDTLNKIDFLQSDNRDQLQTILARKDFVERLALWNSLCGTVYVDSLDQAEQFADKVKIVKELNAEGALIALTIQYKGTTANFHMSKIEKIKRVIKEHQLFGLTQQYFIDLSDQLSAETNIIITQLDNVDNQKGDELICEFNEKWQDEKVGVKMSCVFNRELKQYELYVEAAHGLIYINRKLSKLTSTGLHHQFSFFDDKLKKADAITVSSIQASAAPARALLS
jgi:hypothetical protein